MWNVKAIKAMKAMEAMEAMCPRSKLEIPMPSNGFVRLDNAAFVSDFLRCLSLDVTKSGDFMSHRRS